MTYQKMPPIVCLCGSTKFEEEFTRENLRLTLEGNIVLSVGCFTHARDNEMCIDEEQKIALDALHKRKIELADSIFVINPGGYVGTSTRSEIEHARAHGKEVKYLYLPDTFSQAVWEVMHDPVTKLSYPKGMSATDVMDEMRLKYGQIYPLCTVIDAADALKAMYG